jgi:hypothetical protein
MEPKREQITRIPPTESGHVFPVNRGGTVDHHQPNAIPPGLFDCSIRHLSELVVAMGIAEFHRVQPMLTAAPFASTTNHLALPPRPRLSPWQDEDAALAR